MLCDLCKEKQANVFFTQIVNGQVQKVNLCEDCSKKKGVTDPTGFALAELLLGMSLSATDPASAIPAGRPSAPGSNWNSSSADAIRIKGDEARQRLTM